MRTKFLWQVFNALSIAGINIIFVMVMARYIPKNIHGTYAILFTINNFFFMFSQFGLGAALIQKNKIDKFDINNAFFLNLFIGLTIYITLFVGAPSLSVFFDNKIEVFDLRLLGLTLLFSSVSSISLSLMQREFKFKYIFIVNFLSYFISYILVGVFLAKNGYEIKSFIYAQICLQVLLSIIAYKFNSFTISIKDFNYKNSYFFIKFGKDFTMIRLLSLVSGKVDKLILGKTISLNLLANFEKAQYITFLPPRFLTNLTNGFLFSWFSRLQNKNEDLFKVYSSITGILMFLLLPVSVLFYTSSTLIIDLFYGENWMDISTMVQFFSFAVPFITLSALSDSLVRSKNKFKYSIIIKIFYTVAIIITSCLTLILSLNTVVVIQVFIIVFYSVFMNQLCLKLLGKSTLDFLKYYKAFIFSIVFHSIIYFLLIFQISYNLNFKIVVLIEFLILILIMVNYKYLFTKNQLLLIYKLIRVKSHNN